MWDSKLPFFRSLFDRKIPHFYAGFHSHAEDKIEVCTTERRLSELRKKSRSFSLSIYEEGWSKQLFKFILSLICNILSENHNSTIWRPFKNAFKTLWGVVASTSTPGRREFTYHQNHKTTCPQLCFEWTPFDVVHCHYKYIRVFRGSTTNLLPTTS